ncbi:MAG: tetratricopeptide repeat protein [Thaumarchaeota archaeon S15]|nr:MAG: tetratricopeptide repeat protein [Thaumarchaeota archaeon S15]
MDDGLKSALWGVLYRHWPYDATVRAAIWTDWAGMALDELEAQDNRDMQNRVEWMGSLEPSEAAGLSPLDADGVLATIKKKYFEVPEGTHYRIYELVELVCGGLEGRHRDEFARDINSALAKNRSAYTLSNGRLERAMSGLENDAIAEASGLSPTIDRHVKKALTHMGPTRPDYEASISESVKVVESAAQQIGGRGGELTRLVNSLSTRLDIHPTMREQFAHMYRFANKTSRHSDLGEKYEPDSHDAKIMLVWCAAIAKYLVDKAAAGDSPGPHAREGGAVREEPVALAKGAPPDPEDLQARTMMGHALLALGRYADALDVFEKAVAADPKSADAHHGLGRALFMGGQHDKALEEYGRAIAYGANHFMAHLDKGTALAHMGRHKEAVAPLERACMIKPRNAEARLKAARALHGVGRHEEALKSCRRATELDCDNAEVHDAKADVLGALGRHEDALESVDRAIQLDRDNARLHVKRGYVLDRLGRISDALAAYGLATRMDPAMSELAPQP